MVWDVETLWYGSRPWARATRALLSPASWLFGAAVSLRNGLYDRGRLPVQGVELPVVSVGNLSVGGSGKTPLVIWLTERLAARGRRVIVVSRGYGAKVDEPLVILPPGGALPAGPPRVRTIVAGEKLEPAIGLEAGDEALLVVLRTGCPAVTARDRVAACRLASEVLRPELILLDDGFQHRRLYRDLDLVLLGKQDRRKRLLPAGPLRERPCALARADVIVRVVEQEEGGATEPRMQRWPCGLVRSVAAAAPVEPMEALRGRRVLAVAGIARPQEFFHSLRAAGAILDGTQEFSDHKSYSLDDWHSLERAADGGAWIITTEKDLVKLRVLAGEHPRLLAVRLAVRVFGGEELVDRILGLDAKRRGQHDSRQLVGTNPER